MSLVMGNEGILDRATNVVDKSQQAAAEEELNLAMADMRIEAAKNNEKFDQNYVVEKMPKKLEDCSCGLVEDGIEGEYKNYIFTVDERYIAKIESKVGGIRPEITAEVLTEGGVLEGENVEIQVRAMITEGSVIIQVPENMILKSKIMETETEKVYVYTTNKNGNYVFTAAGDSGRKRNATVKINQIIDKPRINVSNNTGTSIIVNVENDYPEGITYTYYLSENELVSNIKEKNYTIENLEYDTKYVAKLVVNFGSSSIESDQLEFMTIYPAPIIKVSGNFERTALEYPLFNINGVMNCTTNIVEGAELTIEIINKIQEPMETYYSLDNGNTWEKYTKAWTISYTGNYRIKAKNVNSSGEEFISQAIYADGYAYDCNENCTAEDALLKRAYDGDEKTCASNEADMLGGFIANGVQMNNMVFHVSDKEFQLNVPGGFASANSREMESTESVFGGWNCHTVIWSGWIAENLECKIYWVNKVYEMWYDASI